MSPSFVPRRCPNVACARHDEPPPARAAPFFRYKGTYPGAGRRPVRRAQCKTCSRCFSEQTESATRHARRPELAAPVQRLVAEGFSVRAVARLLGVTRPTVRRRLRPGS